MARRPIFVPLHDGKRYVLERYVDFEWHAGFARSQKQKNIRALHEMALREYGVQNPLEVSSKSEDPLGVALSSFNLTFTTKLGRTLSVEAAFQGSKVFERGGPYLDIFEKSPVEAKRDERLRSSGSLTKFSFFGIDWPLEPKTAFYDWLYINALLKNPELADQVTDRDGFTDIEFNPERSINCQARSAALFCALFHTDKLDFALETQETFFTLYKGRISDPHMPPRRPRPTRPAMRPQLGSIQVQPFSLSQTPPETQPGPDNAERGDERQRSDQSAGAQMALRYHRDDGVDDARNNALDQKICGDRDLVQQRGAMPNRQRRAEWLLFAIGAIIMVAAMLLLVYFHHILFP